MRTVRREPIKFKQKNNIDIDLSESRKAMQKLYKEIANIEDECNKIVEIAMRLKKGMLYKSISAEEQRKMCDAIVEVVKQ